MPQTAKLLQTHVATGLLQLQQHTQKQGIEMRKQKCMWSAFSNRILSLKGEEQQIFLPDHFFLKFYHQHQPTTLRTAR